MFGRNTLRQALALGLVLLYTHVSAGVLRSRFTNDVQIDYKETHLCEETPGVKAYSGYVTLPPSSAYPFTQNIFFWFFSARNSPGTAPLALWLQGGPGSPSIDQAINENGPCWVQRDSNTTVPNEWSWNNEVNLLYLDQPVMTGFSYDEVTDGVLDMIQSEQLVDGAWTGPLNWTARAGKFASQKPEAVVNTTAVAVEAVWEAVQVWMTEFEEYRRDKISIWSQSYGGHWAPAVASLFHTRSKAHAKEGRDKSSGNELRPLAIGVDSVGIINGFIDFAVQAPSFPSYAINNSYNITAYPPEVAASASQNLTMPGGCADMVAACRALMPNGYRDAGRGTNETITEVCGAAFGFCWTNVYYAYDALSGRDPFDIGSFTPDPFPSPFSLGFLNQAWVQEALGARVNYTESNGLVANGFIASGDFAFGGFIEDLGTLLDAGVKVALINGDRDFRCNWVGGEAVSLAVPHASSADFAEAGYTDLVTNASYVGGKVRQHGLFSFTRVFEAGHEVTSYQPETGYRIFTRTVFGKDVATGEVDLLCEDGKEYATQGPESVFDIYKPLPSQPEAVCYVAWAPLANLCTDEQIQALLDGTAVVGPDMIVVSPK